MTRSCIESSGEYFCISFTLNSAMDCTQVKIVLVPLLVLPEGSWALTHCTTCMATTIQCTHWLTTVYTLT